MSMRKSVGLRPKCCAFLCRGKVDKNVLQLTRPVEKKTAKGVKRKVKDDHLHFEHYFDVLRRFKSYVCVRIQFILTHTVIRIQCKIHPICYSGPTL